MRWAHARNNNERNIIEFQHNENINEWSPLKHPIWKWTPQYGHMKLTKNSTEKCKTAIKLCRKHYVGELNAKLCWNWKMKCIAKTLKRKDIWRRIECSHCRSFVRMYAYLYYINSIMINFSMNSLARNGPFSVAHHIFLVTYAYALWMLCMHGEWIYWKLETFRWHFENRLCHKTSGVMRAISLFHIHTHKHRQYPCMSTEKMFSFSLDFSDILWNQCAPIPLIQYTLNHTIWTSHCSSSAAF